MSDSDAWPPPPPPAEVASNRGKAFAAIFGLLAVAAVISLLSQNNNRADPPPLRASDLAAACSDVTYEISVEPRTARFDVTMRNRQGNTEQLGDQGTRAGVWSRDLGCLSGSEFTYVSAQIDREGSVTCRIKHDGEVVERATSRGEFVIATCSG